MIPLRRSFWLLVALCSPVSWGADNPTPTPPEEWPHYGRDSGGMRHSPLTQITRENIRRLQVAWEYRTGEMETYEGTRWKEKSAFESTPILKAGVLYLSTPSNRIIALDVATGKERWTFDPKIRRDRSYSEITSRGVAYWSDAKNPEDHRIFLGTLDGRLIALNATTGKPHPSFGKEGEVDLAEGIVVKSAGEYQVTSPPAVIGNRVVVGSSIGDNRGVRLESGVVRAYDAETGSLSWAWDPIPRKPGEPGYDTWEGPLAHETGGANVWPPISTDPARGLVFVSTSSPSPDYYGGERLGQNQFANSVVALRASDGTVVWAFQTVHHDLWDYDVPMQPVLFELTRNQEKIPALVIGTKSGHLFVLHRDTGEPLFKHEERSVPKSDVPGESSWPTQPFPIELPVFGLRRVTVEDAWGLDNADREYARHWIGKLRSQGPFTPPSLGGSVHAPSSVGGFNWGGLTVDPGRGLVIGAVNRVGTVIQLIPRKDLDVARARGNRLGLETSPMNETPYGVQRNYLLNRAKGLLPITPPPWGTLAAVDLNSGTLKWEVPLGFMVDPQTHPEATKWGSIHLGGPVTTVTGLVFMAGTLDNHLRALDVETGRALWESPLPASAQATPMICATPAGRQLVVICAGGHGKLGSKQGDFVVAFGLPEETR